jgi:hypothetical protein
MSRFLTALVGGVGAMFLAGGLLGFVSANLEKGDITATGLGPLNGLWPLPALRFAAVCATGLGAGLLTFALLARRR